ncbi:MAG TPA: hypothetical protein GX740_06265 [Acholeplasmataceae bacterium]|nr:hypothetical protein [Acholeplasmataceae bacterium]
MKWSLQQLNKFINQDYSFDATFDFTEEIKNIDDILGISETKVHGKLDVLDLGKFRFELNIKCTLILEDARTLDPVDFLIDLDVVETYSVEDYGDDDAIIIETNTVDLRPVIWEHILLQKPIRFVKE